MLLPLQVAGFLPAFLNVGTITSLFTNKSLQPKPCQPCPSQLFASQSRLQPPGGISGILPCPDLRISPHVSQIPSHLPRSHPKSLFPTYHWCLSLPASISHAPTMTPTPPNRTVHLCHHPTPALPLTTLALVLHWWGCPLSPDLNALNISILFKVFTMILKYFMI